MGVDSADRDKLKDVLPAGSLVTVFGGSGFLGRHIVHALARRGYRVRVAVRRPNDAQFLRPMGVVGQVEPVQANIRDDVSVRNAVEGADAVVNLVGILYETGRQTFEAVQADGAGRHRTRRFPHRPRWPTREQTGQCLRPLRRGRRGRRHPSG